MKCRKAYGIMPVGENDRSAHVAQQKAPEVATPGLFYSVLGGWLNPKAGYQLFFSVQPFADVVGNAELKKQNEKLKQDKLNAEQEAEATVSSVKREYEAKGRELDRRIGEAAKQSAIQRICVK